MMEKREKQFEIQMEEYDEIREIHLNEMINLERKWEKVLERHDKEIEEMDGIHKKEIEEMERIHKKESNEFWYNGGVYKEKSKKARGRGILNFWSTLYVIPTDVLFLLIIAYSTLLTYSLY